MTFVSTNTGPWCRATSQIDRVCDAMRREQIRQVFDGQIRQAGDAAERDVPPVDGESEDLDEGSRKQGGRTWLAASRNFA